MNTPNSEHAIHHAEGVIMGGPWQVRHVTQAGIDPERVVEAAFSALQHVDKTMSHFKPDSALMRLNRTPLGTWLPVPAEMVTVMATAAEFYQWTDGALNIALGRAIDEWGFGAAPVPTKQPTTTLPPAGEMGYVWQNEPPAVQRTADVTFNLSALAKGFAVDHAAQAVRALGIQHFLIEAAGEIYAQGTRAAGMPWHIGLELPVPGQVLVYGQLALADMAIATSGGYRKHHKIADKTVIHALNPTTAAPIDHEVLAVTVLDHSCMRADALATALFIKGGAAGSAFADRHGIPALFLLDAGDDGICEIRSQAWMDYLARVDLEV